MAELPRLLETYGLGILASLNLESKFLNVSQRLVGPRVEQGICLGENLVLHTAASNTS